MYYQPEIEVGLVAHDELQIKFNSGFHNINGQYLSAGAYRVLAVDQNIIISSSSGDKTEGLEFLLSPAEKKTFFQISDVIIGVGFHWEQKEKQRFGGKLKLITEKGKVRAINIIPIEEYLKSVISSEMSASCSHALLQAHAVISRSWLLAQIEKTKSLKSSGEKYLTSFETTEEISRWYDREDHSTFDVCADDHCQRYQGLTKIHSDHALKAVNETFGEVLMFEEKICDTRFSKCCGGISENFENVWEAVRHPYITKVVDSERGDTTCVDLRQEEEAEMWIRNHPHAFCNTTDHSVLKQILPGYDQSTTDFYRWKVEYSQSELSALIRKRSGIDFGDIIKLEPVQRGHSGRLIRLRITGTKRTLVVGKELEIRKWLSESHLYSSAFVIDHLDMEDQIPAKFQLTGAGWGHGAGLCQIGAAVMGEKGYSYREILNHYFQNAKLKKLYT
jgi:stage II sporulation protein D